MKKTLKRIMALMLSLVMIFGCIPSFTNVASAQTLQLMESSPSTLEELKNDSYILMSGLSTTGNSPSWKKLSGKYAGVVTLTFETGVRDTIDSIAFYAGGSITHEETYTNFENGIVDTTFDIGFVKAPDDKTLIIYRLFDFEDPTPVAEVTLGTDGDLAFGLEATLGVTVPDDANYSVDSELGWYAKSDLTDTPLSNTDKVNDRVTYYKKITLKGNTGYEFNSETTPVINSIPGVNIIEDSKKFEGNKYSFIISKEADGRATYNFTGIADGQAVNYNKSDNFNNVATISVRGKDNKDYVGNKINVFNIANEYNAGTITGPLDKMESYSLTLTYRLEDVKNTDTALSVNNIGPLDKFNIVISGINDWIIKEPEMKYGSNNEFLVLKVKLESKYIRSIDLDGEGAFNAGLTNYTYKAPENANYEVVSTTWYTNEDCEDANKLNSANLAEDTTYYAKVVVRPTGEYLFWKDLDENEYVPRIYSYDGIVSDYIEIAADEKSLTCIVRKETPKSTTFTINPIVDKTDLAKLMFNASNYASLDPMYCTSIAGDVICLNGDSENIGEYIAGIIMNDVYVKNHTKTYEKGIDTNSIKTITYGSKTYDVNRRIQDVTGFSQIPSMRSYLRDNEILPVTNRSMLYYTDGTTAEYQTENYQKGTIFKLYDFGKPGNITFSGLNAGNLVKDVSIAGNLGTDGTVDSGTIEIGTVDSGVYTKITNLEETKFEAGKNYRIKFYIENEKYDIESLTINGQNVRINYYNGYPIATGLYYTNDTFLNNFKQKMCITYDFSIQGSSSSGGSSKKYKADDKDTAEKISGSGKKGSKRIVTPEPNRKVESVIVTDKDGNKYEVTNEGDGTYSFIQPGKDVNVEVKYKNRLIELTIGSLDASVDDVHHTLDVVPKVVNDRTMLPIRFVAENLGAKVDWDEKDPDTVIITRGDTKIEITLGSDIAKVNGKDYKLDSVAFAENDRTYLPVRFVSEKLNAIVEWNEAHPMDVKIYERQ